MMKVMWGLGCLVVAVVGAGCLGSNATVCANGRVCPEGTACDEVHTLCVQQSQLDDCAGKADGEACAVNGTDTVCRDQVCLLQFCGDGIKNAGEECDGDDLGGADCTMHGFYAPDGLACDASCKFDTSACEATCGDKTVNGDEECDGSAPVRNSCTRLGFDAGLLGCNAHCGPSTAACRTFGWTREDGPAGNFAALWANANDDIFAGGDLGVMHYDGKTWAAETTGLTGAVTGIWGRTGEAFAAAYNGQIAHLANGTWTKSDVGAYIAAISGSGTEAYAVGALPGWAGPGVFHSSSGGAWGVVPGFTAGSGYLGSVQAMGPFDVYVLDDRGVQHWDGNAWTRSLLVEGGLSRLYGVGPDLYAAGPGVVYHHDSGGWTSAVFPYGVAGPVAGNAKDDLYALGGVDMYRFDGVAWIPVESLDAISNAVIALPDGELIGAGNGVWRYRGDGRIDLPPAQGSNFRAVFAKSATEFVAVGEGGLIARFKNDRWHLEPSPASVTLTDVWGDFAIGAGSIIHWNGTAWTVMSHPGPAQTYLRSIWGSSATDVWAVGIYEDTTPPYEKPIALHYNGSWSTYSLPTVPAGLRLSAVSGTSSTDVYFVGTDGNDGSGYVVAGNPSSTMAVQQISANSLSDVWAAGVGNVWLVGNGGGVYHGSGTTFTAVQSGTTSDLAYIVGLSATEFRIVLNNGFYAGTQYIDWQPGSQTFSEKLYLCDKLPMDQRMSLYGMAAVGTGDYVAVGPHTSAIRERGAGCTLEIGTDFAQDTQNIAPVSDGPDSLYFTMLKFNGQRELYHFDGKIVSGIDQPVSDPTLVWASSPTDVWTVSNTGEYSRFNGTSWSATSLLTFNSGLFSYGVGMSGTGPSDVWIVNMSGDALHYNGASWTESTIGTSVSAVWSNGPNLAFAAPYSGPVQCWNGASWMACSGAVAHDNGVSPAFGGSGPNDVYLVGPKTLVSHWDGTSWTDVPIDNPNSNSFTGVAAASPSDVFAVDYGGAMMHFDGTQWSQVRAGDKGACFGLVYSNKNFWAFSSVPKRALTGLTRSTAW